jgi:inhibitor of cysteine peptidase
MQISKSVSVLALTLCALCLPAFAQQTTEAKSTGAAKVYTEKDSGKKVELDCGALFDVQLSGNPTTGYSWTVAELSGKAVEKVGDVKYTAEATNRVGSGGTFLAHFKAAAAGKSTLKMAYARPWEKDVKPVKEFTLEATVKEKPAK